MDCFASLAKTHQTENQRAAKLRDDRSRNFVADSFIQTKNWIASQSLAKTNNTKKLSILLVRATTYAILSLRAKRSNPVFLLILTYITQADVNLEGK